MHRVVYHDTVKQATLLSHSYLICVKNGSDVANAAQSGNICDHNISDIADGQFN